MKESSRIGILIFLYNRDELTAGEKNELVDWRMQSPENEKLFFQLTDPKLIRQLMQECYQERDRGFEKLKTRFPWLSEARLSGSLEEAAKLFAETPVMEEDDQPEDFGVEYADPGLSPVEYWGSSLSRLDEEEEKARNAANEIKVVPLTVGPRVIRVWRSSKFLRRSLRVAGVFTGIFLLLNLINVLFFDSDDPRYRNYQAKMISPDGIKTIVNDYERGKADGAAGIKFAPKTERGEPIYIAANKTKAAKDKLYQIYTDPGQEFILKLPEGTLVWMNSLSKIKYPANFHQDTIRIEIEGEAYLEISKNTTHHYIISPSSVVGHPSSIYAQPSAVLNINTFPGNGEWLVTLVRGNAAANWDTVGTHPENQFRLMNGKMTFVKNDTLTGIRDVDTTEIIAWKNGEFYYKDTTLPAMMPAIARWYNVDVVYNGKVPDKKFSLRVPRSQPLSEVLDILKKQGVHISLQGKTLMILE
jgi:Domain of unknown function (DUF4974)/FecR protein